MTCPWRYLVGGWLDIIALLEHVNKTKGPALNKLQTLEPILRYMNLKTGKRLRTLNAEAKLHIVCSSFSVKWILPKKKAQLLSWTVIMQYTWTRCQQMLRANGFASTYAKNSMQTDLWQRSEIHQQSDKATETNRDFYTDLLSYTNQESTNLATTFEPWTTRGRHQVI